MQTKNSGVLILQTLSENNNQSEFRVNSVANSRGIFITIPFVIEIFKHTEVFAKLELALNYAQKFNAETPTDNGVEQVIETYKTLSWDKLLQLYRTTSDNPLEGGI